MVEGFAVAVCVAASVAVDDLLAEAVGFGAVELELGADVIDGELKASDLAELGGVGAAGLRGSP